jgi:serine/threonine protein kinase
VTLPRLAAAFGRGRRVRPIRSFADGRGREGTAYVRQQLAFEVADLSTWRFVSRGVFAGADNRSTDPMPLAGQQLPQDALPPGTSINGYRIEAVLGQGGFGITYRVVDLLEQSFAAKEYFPRGFARRSGASVIVSTESDVAIFEDCRRRFVREAQILADLGHHGGVEGVARVVTCFEANNTAFSIMELLAGETLDKRIKKSPTGLPAAEIVRVLRGILTPLEHVHAKGILHRDVKPSNIILRLPDHRPVLIDFGSARDFGPNSNTTFTQIFSGGYAPIEQLVGSRQGPFSDIYSVGTVAYRAIGGTLVDAFIRHQALLEGRPDPLKPAAEIGSSRYSKPLLTAIDRALAVSGDKRPQHPREMLAALADAEHDSANTTVAPSPKPTRSDRNPQTRETYRGKPTRLQSTATSNNVKSANSLRTAWNGAIVESPSAYLRKIDLFGAGGLAIFIILILLGRPPSTLPPPPATTPNLVSKADEAERQHDFVSAVSLYQRATDLGNAEAALKLSWHYRDGKGVPRDGTVH